MSGVAEVTISAADAHPYAEKFPMMGDAELAELAESIRANGLRSPITITPDGLILDGRNRYAACQQVGVEPSTVVYECDDLAEFVIDCNSTRRNMSTGARAMSTALVLAADGRRENGRWKRDSLPAIGGFPDSSTWVRALRDAGIVLDHAPELAEQVVNGDLALNAAYVNACEARDAERNKLAEEERLADEEADARTFILDTAPELAGDVEDEEQRSPSTYVEARDLWNRRNREEAARLKAEQAADEQRKAEYEKAMTQLYSEQIGVGLRICGGFGGYADITELMAEFSPGYLYPPQIERYYAIENLRRVKAFAENLIAWQEARS